LGNKENVGIVALDVKVLCSRSSGREKHTVKRMCTSVMGGTGSYIVSAGDEASANSRRKVVCRGEGGVGIPRPVGPMSFDAHTNKWAVQPPLREG